MARGRMGLFKASTPASGPPGGLLKNPWKNPWAELSELEPLAERPASKIRQVSKVARNEGSARTIAKRSFSSSFHRNDQTFGKVLHEKSDRANSERPLDTVRVEHDRALERVRTKRIAFGVLFIFGLFALGAFICRLNRDSLQNLDPSESVEIKFAMLSSEPPGAWVYGQNGQFLGQTPLGFWGVSGTELPALWLRHSGFEPVLFHPAAGADSSLALQPTEKKCSFQEFKKEVSSNTSWSFDLLDSVGPTLGIWRENGKPRAMSFVDCDRPLSLSSFQKFSTPREVYAQKSITMNLPVGSQAELWNSEFQTIVPKENNFRTSIGFHTLKIRYKDEEYSAWLFVDEDMHIEWNPSLHRSILKKPIPRLIVPDIGFHRFPKNFDQHS